MKRFAPWIVGCLVATLAACGSGGGGSATPAPPGAPAGLGATAGPTQVALTWSAVSGATTYSVYRSTSAGVAETTANRIAAGLNSVAYTDTGLTNGITYHYAVTASNSGGESGESSEVAATPQPAKPNAPAGLGANPGSTQVALAWNAISGATSYSVYRSTAAGVAVTAANRVASGLNSAAYTDMGLANDTTYYYVVTASNAGGESAASNEVSAMPQLAKPDAPTGLGATPASTQVALTWSAIAGATYSVYRSTSAGVAVMAGNRIASGLSSAAYTDTSLANGTTYYYVVTASNAAGESVASGEVSATPQVAAPGAPTGLGAIPGSTQATLTWNAISSTTYSVYRSTSAGVAVMAGNRIVSGLSSPVYIDMGLANGTTYYYVVTASNSGGESGASGEVAVRPQAASAADLRISEVGSAYYGNGSFWFEVYNGTAAAVNLSQYSLRANWGNVVSSAFVSAGLQTVALPAVSIPPSGYLIVRGNPSGAGYSGTGQIYITDASGNYPYWTSGGFLELVKSGATVDFVRWGASTQAPLTSTAWISGSATALPRKHPNGYRRHGQRVDFGFGYRSAQCGRVLWLQPGPRCRERGYGCGRRLDGARLCHARRAQ
ncbi:MAG TPA: hypothetical protein VMH77_09045 [Steroidobacteraceae bacterium]|nr:hypothetical protein [Steroidobacteraceae bacterium]